MTHPMIERRRAELRQRIADATDIVEQMDNLYDPLREIAEDLAEKATHLRLKISLWEKELDALDMEAADPAAHGYY